MKRVQISNKYGQNCFNIIEDPSQWLSEGIANNWWGKPERWQLHKDEALAESYDESDVLEERVDDLDGVQTKWVKLKAEYTIEIEDITAQHKLEQALIKRRAEYPTPEEFLNAFFDGGDEALEALRAKRLEIKAKYPKE
jgi:hypothetical protein